MIQVGVKNVKRTTDEVVEDLTLKFGNKFDYSLVEYEDSDTPIILHCNRCKEAGRSFVLKKTNAKFQSFEEPCNLCKDIQNRKDELLGYLKQNFPENEFELLQEIYSKDRAVKIRCVEHNHECSVTLETVRKKTLAKVEFPNPCKMCRDSKKKSNEKPKESRLTDFQKYFQGVKDLGGTLLKCNNGIAEVKCDNCDQVYNVRIEKYVENQFGCPYCRTHEIFEKIDKEISELDSSVLNKIKEAKKVTKTLRKEKGIETPYQQNDIMTKAKVLAKLRNYVDLTQFIQSERFKWDCIQKYGDADFIVGEYIESSKKIACYCSKCDFNYEALPQDILNEQVSNKMCPNCSGAKPLSFDEAKQRVIDTHGDKYEVIDYGSGRVTLICPIHGRWETDLNNLTRFGVNCNQCVSKTSKAEMEIRTLLYENSTNFEGSNWTVLSGEGKRGRALELDILVDEFNLAIEYDGLMYHSYATTDKRGLDPYNGVDKNHNLKKLNICKSKGYELLKIFDIEWDDPVKKNIWSSVIKGKVGKNFKIYARKCSLVELDSSDARRFMNENHLQGAGSPMYYKVNIGLVFENELVSVMSFYDKDRFNKSTEVVEGSYELYRFASKTHHNVIGGASKILKYFEITYNPKYLTSFANRRWSSGKLYETLGFKFSPNRNSEPAMWIYDLNHTKILHRQTLWNQDTDILYPIKHNKLGMKLTQTDRVLANGYRLFYDCGSLKYIKDYSTEYKSKYPKTTAIQKFEHTQTEPPILKLKKKTRNNLEEATVVRRQKAYDGFIANLEKKFPNKFTYGTFEEMGYTNQSSKIKLICNNCSAILDTRPEQVLKNNEGCSKCSKANKEKYVKLNSPEVNKKISNSRRRKGYELLIEKSNERFPNQFTFKTFEEVDYKGESLPIQVVCKYHGEVTIYPASFKISKYGCPVCKDEGIAKTKAMKKV